jgi:hypothetical protein
MKANTSKTYYSTKEEYEAAHNYCIVEAPAYQGEKTAPARIFKSFKSRKTAINSGEGGMVMTRKQAEKFIKEWNAEYEKF